MVYDDWISYLRSERRLSALTLRNYERDLRSFIDFTMAAGRYEEFDPARVSTDDVREWVVSMADSGRLCAASVNRAIYSLRSYFKFLRERGIVDLKLRPDCRFI